MVERGRDTGGDELIARRVAGGSTCSLDAVAAYLVFRLAMLRAWGTQAEAASTGRQFARRDHPGRHANHARGLRKAPRSVVMPPDAKTGPVPARLETAELDAARCRFAQVWPPPHGMHGRRCTPAGSMGAIPRRAQGHAAGGGRMPLPRISVVQVMWSLLERTRQSAVRHRVPVSRQLSRLRRGAGHDFTRCIRSPDRYPFRCAGNEKLGLYAQFPCCRQVDVSR